jgi:hypothetical protein
LIFVLGEDCAESALSFEVAGLSVVDGINDSAPFDSLSVDDAARWPRIPGAVT